MNSDFCILFSRLIQKVGFEPQVDTIMCSTGTTYKTLEKVQSLLSADMITEESSKIMSKIKYGSPSELSKQIEEFVRGWNDGNISEEDQQRELELVKRFFNSPRSSSSYLFKMDFERSSEEGRTQNCIYLVNPNSSEIGQLFPEPHSITPLPESDEETDTYRRLGSPKRVYVDVEVPFKLPVYVKDDLTFVSDYNEFLKTTEPFFQFAHIDPLFAWTIGHTQTVSKVRTVGVFPNSNITHTYVDMKDWMFEESEPRISEY